MLTPAYFVEAGFFNVFLSGKAAAKGTGKAAFGCIAHLNEILTQYDLVIASPSLETGVSIDIRGHFDAVWGIFQGVQPVNSVRQMLATLRETVVTHIQKSSKKLKILIQFEYMVFS